MRFFSAALIFCGAVAANAQSPVVPHKMQFAGLTLTIRDDARREIQKDVDALTQSPKYFNIKVERARTYFPLIEKIFAEERVPDDFKFLSLQESALIADAVSVSDAVGFWQFKDFTAREVGLRVDNVVDERMNIEAATRGAARYIKQNNFMFNNWVYALQAYQMGAGGVKRLVGDDHDGARHMEINSETYWYVKKFLAHKVAFEEAVKGPAQLQVTAVPITQGARLDELAASTGVEVAELQAYNKWVRNQSIPADKTYTLIVPRGSFSTEFTQMQPVVAKAAPAPPAETTAPLAPAVSLQRVNDIPAIEALTGETLAMLAKRAAIEVTDLMKYNEVAIDHQVQPGRYYYLARKKSRASEEFHKIKDGESLWQVSQQYGVQVKRLRKLNRLDNEGQLPAGTMLWLNMPKPRTDLLLDDSGTALGVEEDKVVEWAEEQDQYPAPQAGVHRVEAGETLYAIAKKHGLSVDSLRAINQLAEAATLKPGQTLKIAVDEEVATGATAAPTVNEVIHEVKTSETLYSVARQYGVSIKELMECNAKKELSVSVGEKLRIPAR